MEALIWALYKVNKVKRFVDSPNISSNFLVATPGEAFNPEYHDPTNWELEQHPTKKVKYCTSPGLIYSNTVLMKATDLDS